MDGQILLIGSGAVRGAERVAAGWPADQVSEKDEPFPWDTLRQHIKDVGHELESIFTDWPSGAPETVSIELGITATGEVGIIVAKSSVSVGTSITLTFARPK